ncbi:cupin domain-containing protein [Burkholderia contaminans]|uniref:cupin domain-containing protein n=1 Tax=Burkholderia contaminans TaxID=488447 RepID=UPI00158A050F|nr:cupin domain-containing protein [Burkholderia contaminans]
MNTPREVLKAADIAAMEPEHSTHPLNENAVRLKRSLGDATGLTQLGFHLMTLMPGHESTEYHRHLYAEECVYVLSGTGEAVVDGRTHAIGPGDFMGFPCGGSAHTMLNTGDQPLVYLVAGNRPEHDVCDYPKLGKRLYKADANKVFVDLGTESA